MFVPSSNELIWLITALSILGVLIRPWKLSEAVWAILGAFTLTILGLLSWQTDLSAVAKGTDVYLFLTGMMLLAELGRKEGLFDWVSTVAVYYAKGSARRLFLLLFIVGTVVTIFLSNDATVIVLTPAVYSVTKKAKTKPLPYLLICAFIANAASFVLPISNPANLVIFNHHMPSLGSWLSQLTIPSFVSIVATYYLLRWTQRHALQEKISASVAIAKLSKSGLLTVYGILLTILLLIIASILNLPLGLMTFIAGSLTTMMIFIQQKRFMRHVFTEISWGILPLVAGLFILVEGLNQTGLVLHLRQILLASAHHSVNGTMWLTGIISAFGSNLTNNLPAGLFAGSALASANLPRSIMDALLIGIDLGPNLSVTGSLATILWLVALRREGETMTAWQFFLLGLIMMPPTLLLALASLIFSK